MPGRSIVRPVLCEEEPFVDLAAGGRGLAHGCRLCHAPGGRSGPEYNIGQQLQAVLDADVAGLELWMREQEQAAQIVADDPRIAGPCQRLIEIAAHDGVSPGALIASSERKDLEAALQPWYTRQHYTGYIVADRQGRIVASQHDLLIGSKSPIIMRVFCPVNGETLVSRPYPSTVPLVDSKGRQRMNVPTMLAATPLRNPRGTSSARGLRIAPELDFTRIFYVADGHDRRDLCLRPAWGVALAKSLRGPAQTTFAAARSRRYAFDSQLR